MRAVARVEVGCAVVAARVANVGGEIGGDRIAHHRLHPAREVGVDWAGRADVEAGVTDRNDLAGGVDVPSAAERCRAGLHQTNGDVIADPINRLASHHAYAMDLGQRFDQPSPRGRRARRQLDDEQAGVEIGGRDPHTEPADLSPCSASLTRGEELDI